MLFIYTSLARSSSSDLSFVPGLDDLCVRFIINLPKEELLQVERICFQVEEAQWYYEDFIRPLDPDLPSLNLKTFCLRIFQHCPLLSQYSEHHHMTAFEEFLAYKTRVPVRGAILLNHELDSVLLVRGWKSGSSWSFPRGKINKDEPDLNCAIREVWEETGFDVRKAGLVPEDEDVKYIEMSMRDQHMRLYVFRDVPMDTQFEPRTRKEIGKIQWYKLSELPTQKKGKNRQSNGTAGDLASHANKFYMVAPFIPGLKKWIAQQKKLSKQIEAPKQIADSGPAIEVDAAVDEQREDGRLHANGSLSVGNTLQNLVASPDQSTKSPEAPPRSTHTVEPSATFPQFPSHSAFSNLELATPKPTAPDTHERQQKSQSLLALLQGKSSVTATATELPQTPAEQIIEPPPLPPSPMRRHAKMRQRVQSERASPLLQATKQESTNLQTQFSGPSASTTMPRQTQSQTASFSHDEIHQHDPHTYNQAQARNPSAYPPMMPYQQTSNPTALPSEQASGFTSAIPAASKLPPPKLTAQSSKLLDLFKSNKPTQAALEAAPVQSETSRLRVALRQNDPMEQASLEVSEIEDHNVDSIYRTTRAPSEVSFEMPADVDTPGQVPDPTLRRPQKRSKQSPRQTLAAWQQFQKTDAVRQSEQRRQAADEYAARAAEEARTGIHYEPEQPVFQETWKQVRVGDDNERKVIAVVKDEAISRAAPAQQGVANTVAPAQPDHEDVPNGNVSSGRTTSQRTAMSSLPGLQPNPPPGPSWNYGISYTAPTGLSAGVLPNGAWNNGIEPTSKAHKNDLNSKKVRAPKSTWDDSSGYNAPLTTGPGLDINLLPENAWKNGLEPKPMDKTSNPKPKQDLQPVRNHGPVRSTTVTSETALVVFNVDSEEALRLIFPDRDRSNIQRIQRQKYRYIVYFGTSEQAKAAFYRQPRHHKGIYVNQLPAEQARQLVTPRVKMIDIHPPRPLDTNTQAERAGVGEIEGSAATKAIDEPQAVWDIRVYQANKQTGTGQPATTPTVVAPMGADPHRTRSEHQNALLNLLKGPPASSACSTPVNKSTLGAPNPTFELSAIPSPGHSREQSRLAPRPEVQPIGDMGHILPTSQPATKRVKAALAPRKSPVSATVDGPLNVPQFDMLSQKSSTVKEAAEASTKPEAPRKSPITILARPQNSKVASQSADQNDYAAPPQAITALVPQVEKQTTALEEKVIPGTPRTRASATVLSPPPSANTIPPIQTDLPAQAAQTPQRQIHPIRRPMHIRPQAHADTIFSPISPLPSPEHSLAFDRRGQQTNEQKKSLLSLFTNTAPASPTATGSPVASASKSTMPPPTMTTGSAILSPQQLAMAPPLQPLSRVQSPLISPPAVQSFEQRVPLRPAHVQASTSLSRRPTGDGDKLEGRSSGRQTPSTGTPKDTKSFLLGYLDSVVLSGK